MSAYDAVLDRDTQWDFVIGDLGIYHQDEQGKLARLLFAQATEALQHRNTSATALAGEQAIGYQTGQDWTAADLYVSLLLHHHLYPAIIHARMITGEL